VREPEAENHLEDLVLRGSVILKYILKKEVWRAWAGLIWLRIWTVFGLL